MAESVLRNKSYAFALKVIKVYKQIIAEKKEYVLSKQFLDSGTSIGALIREAYRIAQSSEHRVPDLSQTKSLLIF